jgi:hypothetical protein
VAYLKITSVKWIIISTENAVYSTCEFSGFFNRRSEFLAQWQRIVAQRHKIVYENVESWYF